jgi:hypothetical protein
MTTQAGTDVLEGRVVTALREAGFDGEASPMEPMPGGHSGLTYRVAVEQTAEPVAAPRDGWRDLRRSALDLRLGGGSARRDIATVRKPIPGAHRPFAPDGRRPREKPLW